MSPADRQFAVPCECSAGVPVTAGQAGGRVACPACGRGVDVPRLRDLVPDTGHSATVAMPRSAAPAWNAGRGLAVAGTALALLAAITAAVLPVGSRLFPQPVSEAAIRAAVEAAPLGDVLAAWRSMAATGVRRPPMQEEQRLQQFTAMCERVSRLLWAVAAAGTCVAVAGFAAGRHSPASAPSPARGSLGERRPPGNERA